MPSSEPSFRSTLRLGFAGFRAGAFPILVFEVLYKVLTTLAVKPLMSFLMQVLLRASGSELAFNDGIWRFALTVPGIVAILLLFGIAILSAFFEFAVVISIAGQALEEEALGIKAGIVRGLWCFGSLKGPDTALFAIYALVLLPLVNMGVTSSLLPQLAIPNFITGELAKTPLGAAGLALAAALVILLFFCLLFVLPAMVLERLRFLPAVKKSAKALRAHPARVLALAGIFIGLWMLLFLGPRWVFDLFFGRPSVSFTEAVTYYGFSLLTPVMLLIWLAASFLQIALMPLLLTLLTTYYLSLATVAQPDDEARRKIETVLDKLTGWLQAILRAIGRGLRTVYRRIMAIAFVKKHKKGMAVVLALLLAWNTINALMTATGIHDPIIVGHRGSADGVENTLAAIQHAIDAGADYAEVDILLSADGVPMVVHDANLARLSGQNVNVYDLTAEELQRITLRQNGYTGQISTLEEVVAYCEGKILLAVEYKLHGHEQADLVEEVMRVMCQSAYQKNSLYLSLDYTLVSQMETQYPDYLTGFCVYGNVGQLTASSLRDMNIDFLLVEEWMVSQPLLRACRNAWLPVYVWTVNDAGKMADYLQMGVSGLVSDYPGTAVRVLGTMYNLDERQKPYEVE
ncbi:glycerophosphoryl diester phosphodiesterase membrane domain-containing protein [Ruminococcaceae bacterium OttesenSCG-928-O06]|nr:glycerophosphoryl diester phosphodiesterase membrane domain-containing protein [Ruminococcaceae bacterium OttesenSCG-928-O06]